MKTAGFVRGGVVGLTTLVVVGCKQQPAGETKQTAEATAQLPQLTPEEMEKAKYLYFNYCSGCHGPTRAGATGPHLLPTRPKDAQYPGTRELGVEGVKAFIMNGTPGGMPSWGKDGILKPEEIDLLARFLQHDPPSPPEMGLEEMKKTWKVYVPVEQRPSKPQHNRNWQNFFGVILRDAGKVAIIDGDNYELVNIVETGYAVHILRASATGRYFYSIGRDGKVTLIDLWMEKPDKVAEVKVAYDARSVDVSKYKGYEDRYAIVGGYWPPHIVILDGKTLEPLNIISTSGYFYDTKEYDRAMRVASIVASHSAPEWVVSVKEAGYIWLVSYKDVMNPSITMVAAERYLHDGGWDHSKRYFLVAANMRNKVCVLDTRERRVIATIETGTKPHPGRGANIHHPQYGWLWATGHLGDNTIAFIGTDPSKPQYLWKVVKKIEAGKTGGNLFVKTHPNSPHLWVDKPLSPDEQEKKTIWVFDKNTFELKKTIVLPVESKATRGVHLEYNKAGNEMWVSAWGKKDDPGTNAIFIFDDRTLEIKHTIKGDWVITPTGKFNVYNTAGDIY